LSLDSNSARAHGDLGATLLIQGKIPEGKAHLLKAAHIAPERATYAANLSYAELLSKQPALAETWARKALELDVDLASAWLNLGLAQVALDQRKAARTSFEKAKELDPSDPRVENNLRDLDELEAESAPPSPNSP
jgi:Flp pilus assembly protein TadD